MAVSTNSLCSKADLLLAKHARMGVYIHIHTYIVYLLMQVNYNGQDICPDVDLQINY